MSMLMLFATLRLLGVMLMAPRPGCGGVAARVAEVQKATDDECAVLLSIAEAEAQRVLAEVSSSRAMPSDARGSVLYVV